MTVLFGGIDIPIYEVFFISAVLFFGGMVVMMLGIFYLLKEMKTLKELIKNEEKDIKELESLEGQEKQNVSELESYIRDNLKKGYTWEQVKDILVKQGHNVDELEKIYNILK